MGGGFFDLILVFIFIVLPVVSNLIKASQKKNKGKGTAKNQQQRQAEPNASQRGVPPTDAQQRQIDVEQKQRDRDAQQRGRQQSPAQPVVARQAAEPTGSAASKSDFERRLAEARAKVQQSMSDGDARNPAHRPQAQGPQAQRPQANTAQTRQPQPTARQVAPAQQARPQLQPQARPQQRSLEVLSPLGGKTAKAKTSVRKPALGSSTSGVNGLLGGLSKKKAPRRTANNSDKLLTMDDKSIMRGLIWKQILDTPKSKKRISNYNKIR